MYGHTITVVNSHNVKGRLTYYSHTLDGVHYQDKQGVRTGTTEHFSDNQGYVQIPKDIPNYLPQDEWLLSETKESYWTLKEDDFIIKGAHLDADPKTIRGLRTIDSIEDIDYSIIMEEHYGVTLK